jgi:hypothetical protein
MVKVPPETGVPLELGSKIWFGMPLTVASEPLVPATLEPDVLGEVPPLVPVDPLLLLLHAAATMAIEARPKPACTALFLYQLIR